MSQQYPPPPGQPDPRQWQGYGQHTAPPPPKRRRRKWPWIVGGIVALSVIIGIANSGAPDPTPSAASVPAPGVPSGVDPSTFNATPTPPAVAAPAPAPAAPSGPLTIFSDGTYEVGTGTGQVAPGTYKSPGADESGIGTCYAATLKNNDGAVGDIRDQKVGKGQTIIKVLKTDGYLDIRGCTFTKAA